MKNICILTRLLGLANINNIEVKIKFICVNKIEVECNNYMYISFALQMKYSFKDYSFTL